MARTYTKLKGKDVAFKNERRLSVEQEAQLFRHLIDKTLVEAGNLMGLDKFYTKKSALRWYVFSVVNRIKKAPELWGISPDAVEMVVNALNIRTRKVENTTEIMVEKEREDFKDKLESIRDTATEILSKKLNIINKSKNNIADVKLKEISDVLKDAQTQLRLVKGESTENIIHYSKTDLDNVSPEEALKLVLKAREKMIEQKNI